MTNVPPGAASARADKYYVYRPLIDLIGRSEGTAPPKGRGYNETLGYGAYTGGDVELVSMTLAQVDALQRRMLKHPKNKWNSSAVGWPQIVRKTLLAIRATLRLGGEELFDADMQDRMACYLFGLRGIDKWLAGRLKTETLITNLAQEWASLPKPDGKGYYSGQRASVKVDDVARALDEVRRRHLEGQPRAVETIEKTTVPDAVDKAVEKQTNGWGWSSFGLGSIGAALTTIAGWPWQTIAVFAAVAVAGGIVALVIGPLVIRRIKAIRAEVSS